MPNHPKERFAVFNGSLRCFECVPTDCFMAYSSNLPDGVPDETPYSKQLQVVNPCHVQNEYFFLVMNDTQHTELFDFL